MDRNIHKEFEKVRECLKSTQYEREVTINNLLDE